MVVVSRKYLGNTADSEPLVFLQSDRRLTTAIILLKIHVLLAEVALATAALINLKIQLWFQ